MNNILELLEHSSDPAFAVDSRMQIVGWNSGAEALLGYTAAEAIGQGCACILRAVFPTGEPLCSSSCEGRACFANGRKWSISACRLQHKNGSCILAGISTLVVPPGVRLKNGDSTSAVIFLREVSEGIPEATVDLPMRVSTFGNFSISSAGKGLNVESWKRKQAVLVLKCLINQLNRPVHRERLIEWIWPDADPLRGWQRLKVAVSFLRSMLRKHGVTSATIDTIGQTYLLRSEGVWLDSAAFVSLVTLGWKSLNDGNRVEAQTCFEEAEGLYCGDYFEDEPYAEWCAAERERLREMYLELLAGLAECYASSVRFMDAARVCRTALAIDPCRESFLRELLENLAKLGQPDWAKAQYIAWRRKLVEDIGFEPAPETEQAFQRLVEHRNGGHDQGYEQGLKAGAPRRMKVPRSGDRA